MTPTTADGTGGSGDETGDDTGGASSEDDGCNCSTDGSRNAPWSLFALFGIGAIRRRRQRS